MSSIAREVSFAEVPKGRLAIWLLVAGEVVIFGGGVMAFLLARFKHVENFDLLASLTSTPMGATNTVVLLTSSFFIVMAHHYAVEKELKKMGMFMWLTILLGLTFLVIKSFEWYPKIAGDVVLGIDDPKLLDWMGTGTVFWSYYYFLTGMHAVHVILGMLLIAIIYFNTRNGKNLHRVEMAGIYWHFVDIVWIFLFPTFYLSR